VHATFELTDNMQSIIESDVNRYITGKSPNQIAESAEKPVTPSVIFGAF